ncbi:uncharacterized protein LOC134291244 [Aedes albopictus]|uniref:Uncharacterized protein n=1 Tax=Aedes albopictus TaxID=7160 RepID=A0ABM1ZR88_AEDAL
MTRQRNAKPRNRRTASSLLEIEELEDGTKVKAELHPSMNECKGVIRCPALANRPDDDVKEKLNLQKILQSTRKGKRCIRPQLKVYEGAKRVIKCPAIRNKKEDVIPKHFEAQKVTPIIDSSKVTRPEHAATITIEVIWQCTNKAACGTCGKEHTGRCQGQPKCANLGGCPAWKQEIAIRRKAVTKGISIQAARAQHKKTNKDYLPLRRGTPAEPEEGVAGPSGIFPAPPKRRQWCREASRMTRQRKAKPRNRRKASSLLEIEIWKIEQR